MALRGLSLGIAVLAGALAAGPSVECTAAEKSGGVTLLPIELESAFPDAVAPDALRYACSRSEDDLARYFAARRVILSRALLHRRGSFPFCHLLYEPTVPGFRAYTEDRPVTGLYVAVAPEGFLNGRIPIGDSFDVARDVLSLIGRPIDVMLSVSGEFDPSHWPAAAKRHFGGLPHRFRYRRSGAKTAHPWAQDHQEAGHVDGRPTILVPRRLYEGRTEDGEEFAPLLDMLSEPLFARSKLSWEGGDLQFVRHPRTPERTIVVQGGTADYYWGRALTPMEVAYVLLTEFGADLALDTTATQGHSDYAVAFLPGEPVALVAEPVRGDALLFRSAAAALYEIAAPYSTTVVDLHRYMRTWNGDLAATEATLRPLLDRAWKQISEAELVPRAALEEGLERWAIAHCGGESMGCFGQAGREKMLRLEPSLLKQADDEDARMRMLGDMSDRLIGLMEAQLPRELEPRERALDGIAASLRQLGFETVRVPFVYAPDLENRWAGVSYANVLIVDKTIFVPALGLGAAEERYFDLMRRRIGRGYEIAPIDARYGVLNNGGIHCVFAVHREPL